MKDHKDLDVWKQAMVLVEDIYLLTKNFPAEEQYGLSSQMKRAAVSVPSTIAEGAGRKGDKEFIQFLYKALGSVAELATQVILSPRLQFVDSVEAYIKKMEEIKQMSSGLIRLVKNRSEA